MSYLALYRKYRSKTFDEIVGQKHITQSLINQIKNDEVGHAYLFTGTRGTGKTSIAKIFAKAINCLSPVNGSPCGKCAACQALNDMGSVDIFEIDAASNNRVDEIRELRERSVFLHLCRLPTPKEKIRRSLKSICAQSVSASMNCGVRRSMRLRYSKTKRFSPVTELRRRPFSVPSF